MSKTYTSVKNCLRFSIGFFVLFFLLKLHAQPLDLSHLSQLDRVNSQTNNMRMLAERLSQPQTSKNAEIFRDELLAVLNQAKAYGIDTICDLQTDDLINKVKTVKILAAPRVRHQDEQLSYRASAQWSKLTNSVTISEYHYENIKPQNRAMVSLHESLGLYGNCDDNFSITGQLQAYFIRMNGFLSNPERNTNPQATDYFKNTIACRGRCGGGSTGVRGGGDTRLLGYMTKMMSEVLLKFQYQELDQLQFRIALEFIRGLKLSFLDNIPQGTYKLFRRDEQWHFVIPNNPTAAQNIDLNDKAIENFVDLLEKLIKAPNDEQSKTP